MWIEGETMKPRKSAMKPRTQKPVSTTEMSEATKLAKEVIELEQLRAMFTHQLMCATSDAQRFADLMRRKSALKWSEKKSLRMLRRLNAAQREQEQAVNVVDYVDMGFDKKQKEATAAALAAIENV